MKIVLCVHGYPPELVGGTELSTQRFAAALVRAGHEVLVFAGTLDWEKRGTLEETRAADGVRVLRYSRDDLYFDHWHKGRSAGVRSAFARVLEDERPDVVHVHHWIRLTRDLIATAARAGIPAIASLHDAWTSCLVAFRIRPATRLPCDAPLAVDPCIECARVLDPPTPWMDAAEEQRRFAEHRADLVRELELARAVVVPTASHARTIEQGLGLAPGALRAEVVRPAVDLPERTRAVPSYAAGDVLRIGSWGHYAEHKGLEILIDAVRALPDPTRVELRLAGGTVLPEHRARLEERALGLPVRFGEGYAPQELGALPVSDVHLFASGSLARESWGLVVDEALALGLPVVLPKAGAFAERTVGAEWAQLYEQARANDLARLLQELLEDPVLLARMAAAVPPTSALHFDGDAQAAALASVFERARVAGPPLAPDAPDDARDLADQRSWDQRLQGL